MKKYLFIATALAALASCSSDEFVGDNTSPTANNTPGAIQFTSNAPRITRATAADYAKDLDYSFYVYATKTVGSTTSNVFAHNPYSASATTNTPYVVWWQQGTANKTSSNTYDWEYVGAQSEQGTSGHTVTPSGVQTIKYWDYSADNYIFTAYKNNKVGTTNPAAGTVTNVTTTGFTFEGTAAQFAGLYVADKLTITDKDNEAYHGKKENKIGDVVVLTFRSGATKVRLGIYETINGYEVQNVKFRPNNKTAPEFEAATGKAQLSGSFNGTSSGASGTYNITYNATTGIAEFDNTATTANKYFDFGTFVTTAIGTSSTAPTWANGSYAYQSVLPNTDNVGNMILYVDYDLYNDVSEETIHVKGAKAVVPAMYMTWNPNYAYTYLFKISDNTNGTTGTEGTSPEGLFPITFDAVTIATTDGQEVGIITTVSTPAITTYQEKSVIDKEDQNATPAISDHGITYAHANGPIYITVNEDGTLKDLSDDNTKLYTVDAGTTEADLMLASKTKTSSDLLSILNANEVKQGVTFASGKAAKFTPAANTTYAVEYLVSAAVAAEYTAVASPDVTNINTYYELSGSDPNYTYTKTTDTAINSAKTYYTLTTPAKPAVYQYKIIIVGADPSNP